MSIDDYSPPTGQAHLTFWFSRLGGSERCYVYVIQGPPGTPIKIGYARDPRKRLATLQTGNPIRLELIFVIPGGAEMEGALHRRLADSRIAGEWFDGPEVVPFLAWFSAYCEQEKDYYWRTGELPRIPPGFDKPKPKRVTPPSLPSVVMPLPCREPTEIDVKLQAAARAGFNSYEIERFRDELELEERRKAL